MSPGYGSGRVSVPTRGAGALRFRPVLQDGPSLPRQRTIDGPVTATARGRTGRWLRAVRSRRAVRRTLARPLVALLALSLLAAAGAVVVQVRALATDTTGDLVPGLSFVAAAALLLAVPALLARAAGEERHVRRMFLAGALVLAATGAVAPLVASEGLVAVVTTGGALVAGGLLYQGLIHWNRVRTLTSDPSDWLNGASSMFANAALANLVTLAVHGRFTTLPSWQVQVLAFGAGGAVVLFGTALTVTWIGGLARDPRAWCVNAAVGGVLAAHVACLLLGDAALPLVPAAWLLCAAVVAACAVARPRTAGPRPADNRSTVVGAIVVLLSGVVILVVEDAVVRDPAPLVTAYAAVAVLGGCVRIARMVGDLSHLARTWEEARTDDLTGVANRRGLITAVNRSLARSPRTTLLVADLDRFKAVNDRYGHEVGDELLRAMAQVYAGHVPPGGLLARLGGDEFAVLLDDVDLADAVAVARALVESTAPIGPSGDATVAIEASVGVAPSVLDGAETDGAERVVDGAELLRRADVAMYTAKRSGAGVGVYDGAADRLEQERMRLVEDLGRALAEPGVPQVGVFFQPQVDVATGRVTGAEALVRWYHAELGVLTPDRFVHLAEVNGLVTGLTAVVMRSAAEQAERWRAAGHELRVSVNLSARCLGEPTLFELLDEVLAGGLEPRRLVLEVTETSLMTNPEPALDATRRIAGRGVGISIDDYGTGYSSLSYLNDLPAAELKIDKSFVGRAVDDPRTAAIVAGTVELAHRLGLRLVAEGVADAESLALMSELGCDESQGYLHSRPLPAEDFLAWLGARAALADVTP